MKLPFTILLIAICLFYGCSPDIKSDSVNISANSLSIDFVPPETKHVELEPMNSRGLNGRVKSLRYISNPISNPKTLETEVNNNSSDWTCWFDESGRELGQLIVDHQYKYKYKDWDDYAYDTIAYSRIYDESGRLKTYIDKHHRNYVRTDYYYNSSGKVRLAERSNREGWIFERITNEYDRDGQLVKRVTTDSKGRNREVETWDYGNDGYTLTSLRYSDIDYMPDDKVVWKYDEAGNEIWFKRYGELGTDWIHNGRAKPNLILFRESYSTYDEKNNKIKNTYRSLNWDTKKFRESSTAYEYDSNARLIKEIDFDSQGTKVREERFYYDKTGRKVKEELFDYLNDKQSVESYDYEYDHLGNWVRRVYYENGEPKKLAQQIIDYYTPSTTLQDVTQKGGEHYNSETYEEAVVAFTEVINSIDAKPKNLHYNRGCAKLMLKDFRGAINDYTKEMKLYPESAEDCYYYRGLARLLIAEKDSGCIDLSHAGELEHPAAFSDIARYCQ